MQRSERRHHRPAKRSQRQRTRTKTMLLAARGRVEGRGRVGHAHGRQTRRRSCMNRGAKAECSAAAPTKCCEMVQKIKNHGATCGRNAVFGGCTYSSNMTCASSMCAFTPALPNPKLDRSKAFEAGEAALSSSPTFCFLAKGCSGGAVLELCESDI